VCFVCLFVRSLLLFLYVIQLLYLTAIRPPGRKDVSRLTDLPLPFLNPVYEPKSTVHLLTLAFTITNQKSNSQPPLHSAHRFHCSYVMYVVCFDFYSFMYYFTCISFAIRPSGPRSASLLWKKNWLGNSLYLTVFLVHWCSSWHFELVLVRTSSSEAGPWIVSFGEQS